MKMKCLKDLLNNNNTEKTRFVLRRQKWRQQERKFFKNSRMRRNVDVPKKNTLKILEMNYTFKNLRSKQEQKNVKKLKSANVLRWSYWLLKNIKRDLRKSVLLKKNAWKMSSNANLWRSLLKTKDLSK